MWSSPNLPNGKVNLVVTSGQHKPLIQALRQLDVAVIETNQHKGLLKAESFHADLQALHIKKDTWFLANGAEKLKIQFDKFNINYTNGINRLCPNYPQNVGLNALRLGGYLFCNTKAVDEAVKAICAKENIELVHVNQGYTKCSVCVVSAQAIITADETIAAAAKQKGVNVLQIRPGYIALPGYNYGFIGGCSGKIAKDCIAFAGDVTTHPDYDAMYTFAKHYGVHLHSLFAGQLLDVGSILPVTCA